MTRTLLAALLLLAAHPASTAAQPAAASGASGGATAWSEQDLEAFVDGVVAQQFRQNHLAGMVITVVRGDQIVLAKGYGYADVARKVPADPYRSGFRPGSVSKLITWTSVMQLVAEGKIDLDADVNQYLKTFKIPDTYRRPITMRALMTHSAGFDDSGPAVLIVLSPEEFTSLEVMLRSHVPSRIRPPGETASYSNYGTALAGYIVQELSGVPYERYVAERVLNPLGMDRSTFLEPPPGPLGPDAAKGYYYRGGRLVEAPYEYIHNAAPAGSMTTTAVDMAKFLIAQLNGGAPVLSPTTVEQMHRRSFAHDPRVPGMALGFYETRMAGRTLLTHKGQTSAFKSQLALLPDERFGVFVSYNSAEGSAPAEALINAIVSRYFAAPAQPPQQAGNPRGAGRGAEIAGAYRTDWHSERTLLKAFMYGKDIRVSAPAGALVVTDASGSKRYTQVAADHYLQETSGEPLVAKRGADGSRVWIYRGNPVMALYKLQWYETSAFHTWLFVFAVLGAVASLAMACILARRRPQPTPVQSLAYYGLLTAAAIDLLFLLASAAVLMGPEGATLAYRVPPSLRLLVWAPVLAACLGAASLAVAALARRRLLIDPIFLTCLVSLAALTWQLHYWNLFGPRFG
ncbi:beta-lactamase family protein [Phenylobacterium sp. LH3H17]|uniref:serine hydrolase domain-containing protein n=1 Tax=Phenylobacterium sp. LH3H17 TaxID=2903901 RepID=UPI0020C9BD50|nr:serine hydrolase domain-containing protein [Phenylobacterium sp. LH3H17]UTP38300.1 beta-lactamase family protein [Phenylobacterium sp. LH3H17]